jgi:hypothetical protein
VIVFQVVAKFVERTSSDVLDVLASASHLRAVHEREVMVVHELGTAWYCQLVPASLVTYSENWCEGVTRPSAHDEGVAQVKSLITSLLAKWSGSGADQDVPASVLARKRGIPSVPVSIRPQTTWLQVTALAPMPPLGGVRMLSAWVWLSKSQRTSLPGLDPASRHCEPVQLTDVRRIEVDEGSGTSNQ